MPVCVTTNDDKDAGEESVIDATGVRVKESDGTPKFTEQEKALAKTLLKQITDRKESTEFKAYLDDIAKNRLYARGKQHDDAEAGLVRANLIHPELKKATNETYAKNPDFTVLPTKTVAMDRYESWKTVGETIELVLKNQFAPAQANLKSYAKRAVRAADTTGFGWLKVVYQKDIKRDPVIDGRIRDVQDDLERLARLTEETDESNPQLVAPDVESRREELVQQIRTLEEQVEVTRSHGLVLSLRPSEHVIFSDDVRDPNDIRKGAWIADEIWMTADNCKERFGFVPAKATRYARDKKSAVAASISTDTKTKDATALVCVYEKWRIGDSRVYTLIDGFDGWLREPYSPKEVGESFYAFFPLFFDVVDGSPVPLPLVTQLRSLQDEHNTARTNFREHREKSVPFNVAHGGDLTVEDVSRLTNPKFMETVLLKGAPTGQPLESVFKAVQNPPIDPSVYTTEHVRSDWEQVTHRGDAARGTVAKAKTAQEAGILQENLQVDTSERRDVIEEWFAEVAQYSAEILLSEMTEEEVKKIAGDGAQWPQMSRADTFNMVQLEVKAGTSGKPNQQQELQKWTQILPELREGLMAVVEMQAAGKTRQATLMMKLLRESLRRFDERLNINDLLPEATVEEQGAQGGDPEQMQQQMEQAQQQLEAQKKQMMDDVARREADATNNIKKTTLEGEQRIFSGMQKLKDKEDAINNRIMEFRELQLEASNDAEVRRTKIEQDGNFDVAAIEAAATVLAARESAAKENKEDNASKKEDSVDTATIMEVLKQNADMIKNMAKPKIGVRNPDGSIELRTKE
jgi:hypothetical protein